MMSSVQSRLSENPPADPPLEYREHNRMAALGDKPQVIGDFLEWLSSKGYSITKLYCEVQAEFPVFGNELTDPDPSLEEPVIYRGDRVPVYLPIREGTEDLLYKYFGLSRKLINIEKDVMLAQMREANKRG